MEGTDDDKVVSVENIYRSIVDDNIAEFTTAVNNGKYRTDLDLEGKSLFIVACEYRRTEMVEYFLQHCTIDLERVGVVEIYEEEVPVTPLWLAVHKGDTKTTEILIKHGALINNICCNTTPLQEACRSGSLDMVQLLVNNKADPNILTAYGFCLRDGIDNPPLLEILLTNGANPNVSLKRNYPLYHLAILSKNFESVRLLLENHCDWKLKDFDGNDAIDFAALECNTEILYFLLNKCQVPPEKQYNSYELLGASYISTIENYEEATSCWKTALKIKTENSFEDKKYNLTLLRSFANYTEPASPKDLDKMLLVPDTLVIRSMVVRDKVLGPTHPETTHRLTIYGMEMRIDGDKRSALEILHHSYHCIFDRYGALDSRSIHIFTHMLKIYADMVEEELENDDVIFDVFIQLFKALTDEVKIGCMLKRTEDVVFKERCFENFSKLMGITMDCLYMLSEEEFVRTSEDMKQQLLNLIKLSPSDRHQNSLLHFAVSKHPKPKLHVNLFTIVDWHYKISEILLRFHADGNARNVNGETPLHTYLRHTCTTKISEEVVNLFIRNGAHIDLYDREGTSVIAAARKKGMNLNRAQYTSLKCIAASVVLEAGIPYSNISIPNYLIDFIEMHKY